MANFLKSRNPILSDKAMQSRFESTATQSESTSNSHLIVESDQIMTMQGAINKTFTLLGILMVTTLISYMMPSSLLMWTGIGGGLIAVLVASFKPHTSPIAAPVYAAFEGLFVGSISAIFASTMDGIVFQAVSLTFATLFSMLIIYKTGIIKVTEKFKAGVMMATGAIMIMYLISIIGSFAGFQVPYLHEGGLMGIGLSLVIIGVAALNLLIDFDAFEKGVEAKAPKYMEWFVSLGLIVTLVWLYIEFLRLLAKLNSD